MRQVIRNMPQTLSSGVGVSFRALSRHVSDFKQLRFRPPPHSPGTRAGCCLLDGLLLLAGSGSDSEAMSRTTPINTWIQDYVLPCARTAVRGSALYKLHGEYQSDTISLIIAINT